MKIGIVGGTFDPIHNGHLMLGEYAYRQFNLDEIWYMPNGNPPHKANATISFDTDERVAMTELAIASTPYFKIQLYEIEQEGVHYSYETMAYFNKAYPEHEFYYVIGADSLFHIEKWVHPELFFKTSVILAAFRDEKSLDDMNAQIAYLNQKYETDIRLLNTPNVAVSSSEIRKKLEKGVSVKEDVPEFVDIFLRVKESISEKRFVHTLGVIRTAKRMAEHYRQDVQKAMLAALLHDCAKGYSETELMHAKLGAEFAQAQYGISDTKILDAIAYHTTGRPEMTFLDKIIYIADYIEPGRKEAPNLAEIRELAYQDIDGCLIMILEQTLSYLQVKNITIDPMTEQTYLYYRKETDDGTSKIDGKTGL